MQDAHYMSGDSSMYADSYDCYAPRYITTSQMRQPYDTSAPLDGLYGMASGSCSFPMGLDDFQTAPYSFTQDHPQACPDQLSCFSNNNSSSLSNSNININGSNNNFAGKQPPALLWCSQAMQGKDELEQAATLFRHGRFFQFPHPVKFTRWLSQQHRGRITPWAVLVTGWREAKPCLSALEAAFTGDETKLRPDARRSRLKDTSYGRRFSMNGQVKIAVSTMVLQLDGLKNPQLTKAKAWVEGVRASVPDLNIYTVCNAQELSDLLSTIRFEEFPALPPPPGLMPAFAPKDCTIRSSTSTGSGADSEGGLDDTDTSYEGPVVLQQGAFDGSANSPVHLQSEVVHFSF